MNRALVEMLGLPAEMYTTRPYEGQVAGSILHIYMNGENILQALLKQVIQDRKPVIIPEKAFMQENTKGIYFLFRRGGSYLCERQTDGYGNCLP